MDAEAPSPSRLPVWAACGLIVLLAALCYSNSFTNSFHYDDIHSILENESIRSLNAPYVWAANSRTRFVSTYSFCLDFALARFEQLWLWHLVNVSAHAGIALLVFAIACAVPRMGRGWALFAGCLFAAHPLCTEPVNYIQARSAQFVLLFSLAAAFCLLRFMVTRRWYWLVLCLSSAALGTLSKEVGVYYVAVACVLVPLAFGPDRLGIMPLLRAWWVWAAASAMLVLTVGFLAATGILHNVAERLGMVSYWPYVASEAEAFFHYVRLLVVPYHLTADYFLRPVASSADGTEWCAAVGLGALSIFGLWLWRRQRLVSFALLWLVLAHVPYLLVPGPEMVVEYRAYPQVLSLALLLPWGLQHVPARYGARLAIATAIVASAGAATWQRNTVWRDGVALWTDCLRRNGLNPRAYNNLGTAYLKEGDYDAARRSFRRALELAPNVAEVRYNMAALHIKEKSYKKAITQLQAALALKPNFARAHNALGTAYALLNHFNDAVEQFNEALSIEPYMVQAKNGLGNALAGLGRYDDAIEQYQKVLSWGVRSTEVYRNLADAYRGKGLYSKAIDTYALAIQADPESAAAHNNLGNVYKDMGQIKEAITHYRRATEVDAGYAIGWNNLGSAYLMTGDLLDAERCLKKAVDADPNYASALCNMGSLMHLKANPMEAERYYRDAVRIDSSYADAWYNLGVVLKAQRHYEEALHCYREAIRAKPGWAGAYAAAGVLSVQQGRRQEGGELLRRAVALDPALAARQDVVAAAKEASRRDAAQ